MPYRFTDRRDAGRMLAAALVAEGWPAPVVLGLARGGVPVAYEVAVGLRAPLDVLVVRKIGAPWQPEFGLGAVTADDPPVYDERTLRALGLRPEDLRTGCERERAEARRRERVYRRDRVPEPLEGRDVVVCDDGLATGVTARAALRSVRSQRPRTLVFAAPVCAPGASARLRDEADRTVCLASPEFFQAVGQFYDDFGQTTDDEVNALLSEREPVRH